MWQREPDDYYFWCEHYQHGHREGQVMISETSCEWLTRVTRERIEDVAVPINTYIRSMGSESLIRSYS